MYNLLHYINIQLIATINSMIDNNNKLKAHGKYFQQFYLLKQQVTDKKVLTYIN